MTQPTKAEIQAALDTLSAVKDWDKVVTFMDGVDARLQAVQELACALSGLANTVANDIDAVAYGEQKEAGQSDEPHAGEMYANAYGSNLQAAQAACYAGAVEEAHDRFSELARLVGDLPEAMTEKEFIDARDSI